MKQKLEPYMEKILNSYYENNAKKLHNVVNQIFYRKYGGIAERDMDEFYSVANDVFTDIIKHNRYDKSKGDFDGFLYGALSLAIVDEFKKQNRDKRATKIELLDENGNKVLDENGKSKRISVSDVYMDTPIGDSENSTIGDMIQSDFNIDTILFKDIGGFQDQRIEKFLSNLPIIQRKILEMKMEDISVSEIKEKLKLSDKQYNQHCKDLKSFANISILFKKENSDYELEEENQMQLTQTMEKSKPDRLSISSIIKKIDKHTIRFDHPLQRESEQWTPSMKGNLISDILQGNPIPSLVFAEQVVNGIAIIWDLDGKQRCTNAYSFSKDGYKITKNIRRWLIEYQAPVVDDSGNTVFDDNNFPIYEKREFDIRGKKFSELPEELQDKFNDYNFEIVQYLNCSGEDIAYHIARYNEGKPMTASQKGITRLGEEYAGMVKSISNMTFFKDMGGYKVSEFKNGTINRVVVESVMAANFLEDWRKKQEDMCEYIKNNATSTVFDDFEDMVERLEKVVTDETSDMFNSKDSFLWFGLFARFVKSETDDKRFIEFMTEFTQSLHSKNIDGCSFDDILSESKSTKDKGIVTKKMCHLEKLMNEYLRIQECDSQNCDSIELFITENLNINEKITQEDIDLYNESLDVLLEDTVKFDSKLRDEANRPSLLAMMAYSYKEDVDLDEWMEHYAKHNDTYVVDQKKNYIYMKEDFEKFINKESKKSA